MASEAQQARDYCEKVTEVERQTRTSLDNILECLQLSEIPANRFLGHEWWDTYQNKLLKAWHKGTQGSNGHELEELNQFTSDVRLEAQVRKDVSDIKSIQSSLNDNWKKDLEAALKRTNSPYSFLFTTSQGFTADMADRSINKLQQIWRNGARREAAQGTNGQASAKFSHFASHIHAFKVIASSHQATYNRILNLILSDEPPDPIASRSNP